MADGRNMSEPHPAPSKTLVDKVIELALSAGGGAVTLLSGLLAAVLILYSTYVLYDTFAIERAASSNAWELLEMRPDILDDPEAVAPDTGVHKKLINIFEANALAVDKVVADQMRCQ